MTSRRRNTTGKTLEAIKYKYYIIQTRECPKQKTPPETRCDISFIEPFKLPAHPVPAMRPKITRRRVWSNISDRSEWDHVYLCKVIPLWSTNAQHEAERHTPEPVGLEKWQFESHSQTRRRYYHLTSLSPDVITWTQKKRHTRVGYVSFLKAHKYPRRPDCTQQPSMNDKYISIWM